MLRDKSLKTILITGGAGFIASNFIPYFINKYKSYFILNIDKLTYAGDPGNLKDVEGNPRYYFLKGDICDRKLINSIFKEYDIRGVIHFAAESHVDNSIADPDVFIKTNINGTFNLCNAARNAWRVKPPDNKESTRQSLEVLKSEHFDKLSASQLGASSSRNAAELYATLSRKESTPGSSSLPGLPTPGSPAGRGRLVTLVKNDNSEYRFHHISTDEVYGSLGETGLFTEKTAYSPNSPYSASKASSDFIVRAFYHTYGLNTITTNCSNNYGPKQHNEKLIPTIIRKALSLEKIPIYGDGKNIRDWLYVLDHCKGIDIAFHKGRSGETYNIGGRNERDNLYITDKICGILDVQKPRTDKKSYKELISFVEDRAGHDRRYAIDASKIEKELGWKAEENFESGILKTVLWYLKNKYPTNC